MELSTAVAAAGLVPGLVELVGLPGLVGHGGLAGLPPLDVLADPFPNGIARYALGGLLVGLGAATIYLGTGIIAGASSFLESTLSYVSSEARFHQFRASRDWRVVFTLGIVGGAAIYALFVQGGAWLTEVQWWRLLGGGVLVGAGTRLGKGCTSGHGVCGVGSASVTSVANVVTFMAIAIGTAFLVSALGVTP